MLKHIRLDPVLLTLILALMAIGLALSYSASGGSPAVVKSQLLRMLVGLSVMVLAAQLPSVFFYRIAPLVFVFGVLLLVAVELGGAIGGGARRWLDLGFVRFQPSELS